MKSKFSHKLGGLALAGALAAFSGAASAHVWQIGWNGTADGSLTFFGVSYHPTVVPGTGTVDDFASRPAGLVINGTNVTFDVGSVVDLEDSSGVGGTSGTVSAIWNGLGLDGFVTATGTYTTSGSTYGKYASVNLNTAALSGLGIGTGTNSVTLTTFSDNVDWAGLTFASATVPINIVVPPDTTGNVPEPGTLALFGLAAIGGGLMRRKAK